MLGSLSEADDAVQEAWLRLSRSDANAIENLGGWLTTVVARVSLNVLRARRTRREESFEVHLPEPIVSRADGVDPEHEALLADSVGLALLVVLETLTPAERLSFVLHDMFAVPFDEIGPMVDRSPEAARQLASRARRRVQGARPASEADNARRSEVINAFLAASRGGDFAALLAVLDPDVVLRADGEAVRLSMARPGSPQLTPEVRGAEAVGKTFFGRAAAAQTALVNGVMSVAWAPGGKPRVVFDITIVDGRIKAIELVADPGRVRELDVEIVG
jgi:RNA polymerase sigma-70 factor (ECF subfamily)